MLRLRLIKFSDFYQILIALSKTGLSSFWTTYSYQILIIFSFLESLWHKETFYKEIFANYLHTTRKKNLHIRLFKILQKPLHIWNAMVIWSRVFHKCIFYHFLDIFYLQTFLLFNWIFKKKINFCKFAIFSRF